MGIALLHTKLEPLCLTILQILTDAKKTFTERVKVASFVG